MARLFSSRGALTGVYPVLIGLTGQLDDPRVGVKHVERIGKSL